MEGLEELLKMRFLFLGVGNSDRGDDAIGSIVVSNLETENKIDCGPVPENFTGRIRRLRPEVIIIIDAVDFGGEPGDTILTEAENARGVALSTHSMPLSLFCKMLPESRIYLLGIQPKSFVGLSDEISNCGKAMTTEINRILK